MKKVFGVGINDVDGSTWEVVDGKRTKKKFYSVWINMLNRCYSNKYQSTKPSYVGCKVDIEWHLLSIFKEWFDNNYVEGYHLDKDILFEGNKVYSSKTCCFVPKRINSFILDCRASKGKYPTGVSKKRTERLFHSRCHNQITGLEESIGYFNSPEKAHYEWKRRKLEILNDILDMYPNLSENIKIALTNRYKLC